MRVERREVRFEKNCDSLVKDCRCVTVRNCIGTSSLERWGPIVYVLAGILSLKLRSEFGVVVELNREKSGRRDVGELIVQAQTFPAVKKLFREILSTI